MRHASQFPTPKQEKIFQFIMDFKSQHDGNSPTFREIMDGCDFSSTSVVSFHIEKLIALGRLSMREHDNGSRMICVNGGQWIFEQTTRAQ